MELIWLRAELLLLLIPFIALIIWLKLAKRDSAEHSVLAAHLMAYLASGENKKQSNNLFWFALFGVLAIIAIAGPSWQKQVLPVVKTQAARVIVMDMSLSMYSTDIAPNRLTQARFKSLDLVDLLSEGETALVAYSGDAFVISPLTSDRNTLKNLIPSLSPEIMPSKGSDVVAGLKEAENLLSQANYSEGDIILLTDGVDRTEHQAVFEWTNSTKYRLNIYAIGSEQGAPISLPQGGFLKDQNGQIVIPKTNFSRLKDYAGRTQGVALQFSNAPQDIKIFNNAPTTDTEETEATSEQSLDGGIYLVLALLPIALIMMRKSAHLLVIPLVIVLYPSQHATASESSWQLPKWLQNKAQQGLSDYQQKAFDNALLSPDPQVAGAAHYQLGNYEEALKLFSQQHTEQALYNQGNALAQLGKLNEAQKAYEEVLKLNPNNEDAKNNKKIVESVKKQQQQQGQQSSEQNQGDGEQDQQQSQQNSEQQNGEQQNNSGESREQGQSQEQQNQQQGNNNEQSPDAKMEADAKQQQQSQSSEEPQQQREEQQPAEAKQQAQQAKQQGDAQQVTSEQVPLSDEEKEKLQMINQLLRKVPDDPSILLRNKMILEHQRRAYERRPKGVEKQW